MSVIHLSHDKNYQAYVRKQADKKPGILRELELAKVLTPGQITNGRIWVALYYQLQHETHSWMYRDRIVVPLDFVTSSCQDLILYIDPDKFKNLKRHNWEAAVNYKRKEFMEMAIKRDDPEQYMFGIEYIKKHPPKATLFYLAWTDLCKKEATNIIQALIANGGHPYLFPRKDGYEEFNQWPKRVVSPNMIYNMRAYTQRYEDKKYVYELRKV